MTLLVISPDYASHLLPLATLATAWRDAGDEVIVATGTATDPLVREFGFRRADLALGRGSNAGVMRPGEQPKDEAASLRGFFDATRRGMVETLSYQARERLTDLMWDPVGRARGTLDLVDRLRPDAIIVDHLAFSARLALQSSGIAYGDVVLGHPSALPAAGEVYGLPPAWPAAFTPADGEMADLRMLCLEVSRRFTEQWNTAARELDPGATAVADAFASRGDTVLYNYPAPLADEARLREDAVFLGSTRRLEARDDEVERWLASDAPFVYVSFGSFLSVRDDVLARVADALRLLGVRAAIATGATDPALLGEIPGSWLVRGFLPQVRLLGGAAAAVTHGGNNSVTEAVGQGVPLVVLPFSTDQFAGAAAIERSGLGRALDPNRASVAELRDAIGGVLSPEREATRLGAAIAQEQRERPGPRVAYEAMTGTSATS